MYCDCSFITFLTKLVPPSSLFEFEPTETNGYASNTEPLVPDISPSSSTTAIWTSVNDPPALESNTLLPGGASNDDLYAQPLNAESFNVGVQIDTCSEQILNFVKEKSIEIVERD